MKKTIAMLLCLCLLTVVFVSCEDNGTDEIGESSGEQASEKAPEKAPEKAQQENTDTDKPSKTDSGDGWTKFY